jgi:hypothetical protein
MSRVVAVLACGFALAGCSMSMPSLDYFRSGPVNETLRVESEPPGADARTTQGQSCRTPCELSVASGGELGISFALNGYQPTTIQVRPEIAPTAYGETGPARLQPNPVYAELQPIRPAAPPKRRSPAKRKQTAEKAAPPQEQAATPGASAVGHQTPANPSGYPWPDPQPLR